MEFWNLVFMSEELSAVRSKSDFDIVGPLPSKNIDTGMGLERVAYLLQDKANMYEIDEMFPVIERAVELSGRPYGKDHEDDVRFRVVDREAVVVRQHDAEVLVMSDVAARLLSLADGVRPVAAWLDVLADEYEVDRETLERDVLRFAAADGVELIFHRGGEFVVDQVRQVIRQ